MSFEADLKILGNNIKTFRVKNKLTTIQVAKKAQIGVDTLLKLEQGSGNPLISTLSKISKALKTDIFLLFKGI